MDNKQLDNDLVQSLSFVMGDEFWNYFKKGNGEWKKLVKNKLVKGQTYTVVEDNNKNLVLARNVYSCKIDIEHFIGADRYRLILDYESRKDLEKKILKIISLIWGELLGKYGDGNGEYEQIIKTDREKVKKILTIVFNTISEFIRYKVSNLTDGNYRRNIKNYYDKHHDEKAIIEKYDNEIKFLQVIVNPTSEIKPPFLPTDAYHIALHKLMGLDLTQKLSKNILKKAFNELDGSSSYRQSKFYKKYQALKFKATYENKYKERMKRALEKNQDTNRIEKSYRKRKKAFTEGRLTFYPPSNPYYIIEIEEEIVYQNFLEKLPNIVFKDGSV